jgi:class 3 adenylate cyclase
MYAGARTLLFFALRALPPAAGGALALRFAFGLAGAELVDAAVAGAGATMLANRFFAFFATGGASNDGWLTTFIGESTGAAFSSLIDVDSIVSIVGATGLSVLAIASGGGGAANKRLFVAGFLGAKRRLMADWCLAEVGEGARVSAFV